MRKLVVAPLLVAPLLLAGCGSQSQTGQASAPAAASGSASQAVMPVSAATVVTGTVALQNPATVLKPGAKLQLSLVDVSHPPGTTVNQQNIDAPTFPQSFRIPFTKSQIHAQDLYVLQAVMHANGRTWNTQLQQPVLTHGQPAHVSLTLVPEPTRSEKVLAAFKKAKRQTGAMQVKSGSSSKIGISRSWQVFSDLKGVEFIITMVNHNSKGHHGIVKTEYAYRDKLPWVVVQEKMPKAGAAPTSTLRVGWGDQQGKVILNQLEKGGKTTTVSHAKTKALHQQAEAEYKKYSKHD